MRKGLEVGGASAAAGSALPVCLLNCTRTRASHTFYKLSDCRSNALKLAHLHCLRTLAIRRPLLARYDHYWLWNLIKVRQRMPACIRNCICAEDQLKYMQAHVRRASRHSVPSRAAAARLFAHARLDV